MRYKYIFGIAGCMFVAGCVMVGLKTLFPTNKLRDQDQQVRADNATQLVENIVAALPEDASENAKQSGALAVETLSDIKREAHVSERFHTAGEKVMGAPESIIKPDSTEGSAEMVELAGLEKGADTVGKARATVQVARNILGGKSGGGGLGGWATGGGLALITAAVGTVTELGRRKLKEQERQRKADKVAAEEEHRKTREHAEKKLREMQEERDKQQDMKLDTMMTALNGKLAELEAKVTTVLDPTAKAKE